MFIKVEKSKTFSINCFSKETNKNKKQTMFLFAGLGLFFAALMRIPAEYNLMGYFKNNSFQSQKSEVASRFEHPHDLWPKGYEEQMRIDTPNIKPYPFSRVQGNPSPYNPLNFLIVDTPLSRESSLINKNNENWQNMKNIFDKNKSRERMHTFFNDEDFHFLLEPNYKQLSGERPHPKIKGLKRNP